MTQTKAKLAALADVKAELSAKYGRLAKIASSSVKRKTFTFKSERYRRQAMQIRTLSQQ